MMQVTKVWWDGEKLMAEPINPASVYKEDSICNKTLIAQGKANPRTCKKCGLGPCIADRVQPAQQEPVARQYQNRDGVWKDFISEKHYKDTLEDGSWPIRNLYTSQPAQQEPEYIQLRHKEEDGFSPWGQPLDPKYRHDKWAAGVEMRLLYTSPPAQRTWVGLTDEDRQAAFESMPDMLDGFLKKWGWLHFSKALEAKLKEKNNG
jgi:hypothetical protein